MTRRWSLDLDTQVDGMLLTRYGGTGNTQALTRGVMVPCANETGSTILRGTVVQYTHEGNDQRIEPCPDEGSATVLGVVVGRFDPDGMALVDEDVDDAQTAAVLTDGVCNVLLDEPSVAGEFAVMGTSPGMAKSEASSTVAFGVWLYSIDPYDQDVALCQLIGSAGRSVSGGGGSGSFGTPAIVLGTAAAVGSIDEAIRRDSTIVAFDSTAPVTLDFGDSAATGSAAVAARRDHVHGMPDLSAAGTSVGGLYGYGFDGDLTLDGSVTPDTSLMAKSGSTYTLARDVHFETLVVNSGVTLRTAGFMLFCRTAIEVNGTVDRSGNDGVTNTGGAAISLSVVGGNSGAGGNGATTDANGSNGNAVSTNGAAGGPGGNGGISGTGRTGGIGGSAKSDTGATVNAPNQGGLFGTAGRGRPLDTVSFIKGWASWGGATLGWTSWQGGASGGGGARGPSATSGGGGGSGGGVLVICASDITVGASGVIKANGGNGANGTGTNAGGGGGGGGGVVALMYDTYLNSGTVQAVAGTNGTGAGGGGNGGPGGNGNVYELQNGGGGGGGGGEFFHHDQAVAATTWTIDHLLGRHPVVSVLDSGGTQIECTVNHTSLDQVVLTLSYAISGSADCS